MKRHVVLFFNYSVGICRLQLIRIYRSLGGVGSQRKPFSRKIKHINIVFFNFSKLVVRKYFDCFLGYSTLLSSKMTIRMICGF